MYFGIYYNWGFMIHFFLFWSDCDTWISADTSTYLVNDSTLMTFRQPDRDLKYGCMSAPLYTSICLSPHFLYFLSVPYWSSHTLYKVQKNKLTPGKPQTAVIKTSHYEIWTSVRYSMSELHQYWHLIPILDRS